MVKHNMVRHMVKHVVNIYGETMIQIMEDDLRFESFGVEKASLSYFYENYGRYAHTHTQNGSDVSP